MHFGQLERVAIDHSRHEISGVIRSIAEPTVTVSGLAQYATLGDRVVLVNCSGTSARGEVIALRDDSALVYCEGRLSGFRPMDRVILKGESAVYPHESWRNHIVDAFGIPLDGRSVERGNRGFPLRRSAPPEQERRGMGPRLDTGLAVLNTFLPIARGQRLGVFSGPGVGKTTLLKKLARSVTADFVVLVLIGDRGGEAREFVDTALGHDRMKQTVVIAETADKCPTIKQRAVWAGIATAEFFRDIGAHVLFIVDSISVFADASKHTSASADLLSGHGAKNGNASQQIAELISRTGTGLAQTGDITALFSVTTQDKSREDPLSSFMRTVLDGQLVLSPEVAAKGVFPPLDILRSSSRSLEGHASPREKNLVLEGKALLSHYAAVRTRIETNAYTPGADAELDRAASLGPVLERFLARVEVEDVDRSFLHLEKILQGR